MRLCPRLRCWIANPSFCDRKHQPEAHHRTLPCEALLLLLTHMPSPLFALSHSRLLALRLRAHTATWVCCRCACRSWWQRWSRHPSVAFWSCSSCCHAWPRTHMTASAAGIVGVWCVAQIPEVFACFFACALSCVHGKMTEPEAVAKAVTSSNTCSTVSPTTSRTTPNQGAWLQ